MRANTVKAHTPNVPVDFQNSIDGWYVVGAWGSNHMDSDGTSVYPAPLISVLGVSMNGNTSTGAVDSGGTPAATPLKVTTNGVAGISTAHNF